MSKPQVRKAGPGAAATGILTVLLLLITAAQLPAQAVAPSQPSLALAEEMNKYPGLMPEFGSLMEKLEREVHLPAPRSKSNLLPLMPEETGYFAAFPNYGDAAHQALQVFQRELEQSAVLRDWWQHGDRASAGPKLQDAFEKFYRLSQFLGDEVVISDGGAPDHIPIFIAQVSKPGLKPFLQQMIREVAVEPKPGIRVFDPQELSAAKKSGAKPELVVLVRSDYVIASSDLEGLRRFSSTLDAKDSRFTSLPFGSRISGMYQGGASSLAAADLQSLLRRMPAIPQQNLDLFQHTGFQDMKYLLWEHKNGTGPVSGTMELSFTHPRRGIASWLAGPATLGSLDFVSPQAM